MMESLCFMPETEGLFARSESAFLKLDPFAFPVMFTDVEGCARHTNVRVFADEVELDVDNET